MRASDYTVTDVGVDYLTATSKARVVGDRWWDLFVEWAEKHQNKLEPIQDWQNRYYQGRKCNKVYWGTSQTMGYIMMAQGSVAKDLWHKMIPKSSYSVTRIDLQVTVLLRSPKPEWANVIFDRVKDRKGRTSTIIQNNKGGTTVYIGSRQSDQFGRVYDKGVQQKSAEPGLLWRYECQIKKPRGNPLTQDLYKLVAEKGRKEVDVIQGYVYRWFNARGVSTLFTLRPSELVAEVGKTVSTAEKKITWLRTQVSPTVRNLIAAGHLKDTIDALGVSYDQLSMLANAEGVMVDDKGKGGLDKGGKL